MKQLESNKNRGNVIIAAVVVSLLVLVFMGTTMGKPIDTMDDVTFVNVSPEVSTTSPGAKFVINVTINPNSSEIYAGQFNVRYNSSMLEAVNVASGPFLIRDGASTFVVINEINSTIGRIGYAETITGTYDGVTEPDTFTLIIFKVNNTTVIGDTTTIHLENVKLSDPDETVIPVVVNNGTVVVSVDNSSPIITSVSATPVINNSAIITWNTDKFSDSLVKFGIESGNYTSQEYNATTVISHSIGLTGLLEHTKYYYVMNSTDWSDNANQSREYNFTISDTIPPTSNHPPDATYEAYSENKTIEWILFDNFPESYEVFWNESQVESGTWMNNTNISVPVNTTVIGTWNYTIFFNDSSGNSGTDTVNITIEDTTPPTSNQPPDATYEVYGENKTIEWILFDNFPGFYEVFRNESDTDPPHDTSSTNDISYTENEVRSTKPMDKDIKTQKSVSISTSSEANVSVIPYETNVTSIDNFTINITVEPNDNEVYSAQFDLHFDVTKLEAIAIVQGAFLIQDGASTSVFINEINNTIGRIRYAEYRKDTDVGVAEEGTLAVISFQVKHIGSGERSELALSNVTLGGTPPTFPTIPIVTNNGFIITAPISPPPTQVDSGTWMNNTNISVPVNTTAIGTWNYTIFFNDSSGNSGTDTVNITIRDATAPVVNTVTLNTTTPDTGDAILVTVNATDNFGVTSVTANSVELTHQGENIWNGTIAAIEGTHSVNVSAKDAAGNTGWNNSTSYTATEAPVLTTIIVSPTIASLTVDDTQLFTATAYDQFENVMPDVVFTWNSSNTTVGTVSPASATTDDDGNATTNFTAVADGVTEVMAANGTVNGTAAVTVSEPANITYSNLNVTPISGTAPLDIAASATVANTGGVAGDYNASFKVDETIVEWSNGTLAAGANTTVSFTHTLTTARTYNVTIDELTATVTVCYEPLRGDLNSDGILTPADAAIALHLAASGGWDPAADVNHDSRITSLDALMILQAAAETES